MKFSIKHINTVRYITVQYIISLYSTKLYYYYYIFTPRNALSLFKIWTFGLFLVLYSMWNWARRVLCTVPYSIFIVQYKKNKFPLLMQEHFSPWESVKNHFQLFKGFQESLISNLIWVTYPTFQMYTLVTLAHMEKSVTLHYVS